MHHSSTGTGTVCSTSSTIAVVSRPRRRAEELRISRCGSTTGASTLTSSGKTKPRPRIAAQRPRRSEQREAGTRAGAELEARVLPGRLHDLDDIVAYDRLAVDLGDGARRLDEILGLGHGLQRRPAGSPAQSGPGSPAPLLRWDSRVSAAAGSGRVAPPARETSPPARSDSAWR